MRIGELAAATNVSPRSLRYYEQQGLLRPERTAGGQRVYSLSSVDRVIRIQELFAAGLCSSRIGQLLPCLDAPADERNSFLTDALSAQRQRLDDALRDVERARDTLDALITEFARKQ